MSNTLSRRRDPFFAEFDNLVRTAFGPSYPGAGRQDGFSPAAEVGGYLAVYARVAPGPWPR